MLADKYFVHWCPVLVKLFSCFVYLDVLIFKVVFPASREGVTSLTVLLIFFICFRMGNSISSFWGKSATTPVNQIQVSNGKTEEEDISHAADTLVSPVHTRPGLEHILLN